MSTGPTIAHGGALALKPGYADNAADALRDLRPSSDAVDFELEHHHDAASTAQLGFWIYLMSDCLLFAGLFATYSVLHARTAGGPQPQSLFDLPYVLAETGFLLVSSFTCGLATLAMGRRSRGATLGWLAVTFALGLVFVGFAGFAMIWHIWWLAIAGFAAAMVALVRHAFDDDRDDYVEAEEVRRTETLRGRHQLRSV